MDLVMVAAVDVEVVADVVVVDVVEDVEAKLR
jgi:hypothetical protein